MARRGNTATRRTGGKSQLLEQCVEALQLIGFRIYGSNGTFDKATSVGHRYVIQGYPHESLYGTPGWKEALIVAPPNGQFIPGADGLARIIVEAKYQEVSGSTDEKLPYIWEAFLASDVPNWIAILDGRYWRTSKRARAGVLWLSRHAAQHTPVGRTFLVTDRKGFIETAKTTWSRP